jgi:small-conductance mechanosensitive channel/CRP-like cAMP-binding protein
MTVRLSGLASSGARRVLPALAIFALVGGVVLLLSSLHVPMTDARSRDYGAFALGIAGALLVTRVVDFLFFDVGYELRRGTAAPALLRQIVSLLIFGLALGALFQFVLSASLPALLATSAIITAVIGLALQETLGNLFSGVALAMERTVQVGDMVRAGNEIGLVEQLSWRAIKVRTMEGHTVLVPNVMASRERLEVFRRGGPPMARILRVNLEYDLPPARARAALEAAVRDLPGLAPHPAPRAVVDSFADSSVAYDLRYWLEDYARYIEIDSAVRERVWYELDREGIAFAYPLIRQHQYAAGPLARPDRYGAVPAAIDGSDLFAPLSPAERVELSRGARALRFTAGETIVREGDGTSSMFVIASGRAAVSAQGDTSESQKVALLEPGSSFGEISLLTGEPRTATVRAVEEALLVEIDKSTLAPILRANPSLVEKLDAIILERRRQTAGRLGSVPGGPGAGEPSPLRARIARFFGLKGLA